MPPATTPAKQVTVSTFNSGTNANVIAATGSGPGFTVLRSVVWSYSGTPTGGRLLIEAPQGTTLLDFDITVGGPGVLVPEVSSSAQNVPMVGTLFAGGGGIVGKLTLFTYQVRSSETTPSTLAT